LGSNGGDEGARIAKRCERLELFLTPFMGAASDALFGGRSFAEFLSAYGSGRIWKREERDS
jgi:hypothetical protein